MRISQVRGLCLMVAGAVAVSTAFVAPAQAETTTGSIAGQITDFTGAPAPSVSVFVSRDDGRSIGFANSNSAGQYVVTGLLPGRFTLTFTTSWRGVRNYPGTVEVADGGQTIVNFQLPATGALAGRLTRQDGSGAAGFSVSANWRQAQVTTDADGNWRMEPVWAVDDTFVTFQKFSFPEVVVQYAFGKLDADKADRVAVRQGETTIVNDTLLPTGTVRVTATDSVTGAPVPGFHAHIRFARGDEQNGVAVINDVPIGTHMLDVEAIGYVDFDVKTVTVVAGQTTDVAVKMVPEARITARVVDAATGQPVPGVCVAAVSATHVPLEGCGPTSDENGDVTLDFLVAGGYKLLAVPQSEAPAGYGAQWVGARGGTGRQQLAVTIDARAGQTVTAPVIRLDRAGTITGTVTKADGTRPTQGMTRVGVLPVVSNIVDELTPATVTIDENDRYTLDFVGPYEWELFFSEPNEAAQWSGGVANPLFATQVRVRAGKTSTYDFGFRAAVPVTLTVTGLELQLGYFAVAVNAVTGYATALKTDRSNTTNRVTLLIVGPQFVRFQIQGRWFGGDDFAHARTFWIPPGGTRSITLDY